MNESSSNLKHSDLKDPPFPSYVIVQDQMRDLLSIQETAIGNLARVNVETLNASRDVFNSTLQSKEDKIEMLQRSIAEDFVPKEKYEALCERLKDECEKHAEAQVALQSIADQLGESHVKINAMEEEAKHEREAHAANQKGLRDQLNEVHARNNVLQSQLNEQLMICKQQQDKISGLSQQVEDLQRTHHCQTQKYRQQLHESVVEKQQEAYLQRMMSDTGRKARKKLK